MTRGAHAVHRWRIASRCPACARRLLSVCTYRTCTAIRDDRPTISKRHVHICNRGTRTVVVIIDLQREARRIFADDLAPALGELGL